MIKYKLHIMEEEEPVVCKKCLKLAEEMMPGIAVTVVEEVPACENCGAEY
jgi:hypothetical protein